MSDRTSPAVAIWEFSSIAQGVHAADAIAKGTPIDVLYTGTTHPGKYVVLVAGDVASVEVATGIVNGLDADVIAHVFLPDVAPGVVDAMISSDTGAGVTSEAVGLVETGTISAGVDAADAAVKAADVTLRSLVMADGINGKAFLIVDGGVGDVDAAVEAAVERAGSSLVASVVIPQLTDQLREDLAASSMFLTRVQSHRFGS